MQTNLIYQITRATTVDGRVICQFWQFPQSSEQLHHPSQSFVLFIARHLRWVSGEKNRGKNIEKALSGKAFVVFEKIKLGQEVFWVINTLIEASKWMEGEETIKSAVVETKNFKNAMEKRRKEWERWKFQDLWKELNDVVGGCE